MKIYLARHGETQWNVDKRISGVTDIPLTERGVEQAKALAEEAKKHPIDMIFASPLKRAQETARYTAEALGLPIITEMRLREVDFGEFEGTDQRAEEYWRIKLEPAIRFPGGESQFDVVARIYPFLDELKEKYPDKNILLVCHGSLGRFIETYFHDGWTEDKLMHWFFPNCCFVEYEA